MYKHVVAQQVITYMRWLKRQPPGLGNSQRPSAAFKLMVYPGVQWCPRYGIHMYPYSPHNMNYPCFFPLSCDSPCFILTSILHIDYVWLCISIYIYTIIYMCIYTNITNTMQFMLLQLYYIRIHVHFICVHGKCLVFARLRNDGGGSLKIIIILHPP